MASLLSPPPKPLFDKDYALTNDRLMGLHFVLRRVRVTGNLRYILKPVSLAIQSKCVSSNIMTIVDIWMKLYTVLKLLRVNYFVLIIDFLERKLKGFLRGWEFVDGKMGSIRLINNFFINVAR